MVKQENIGTQNLPLVLIPLWLYARETLRPPSNFNATGSQFSFLIRAAATYGWWFSCAAIKNYPGFWKKGRESETFHHRCHPWKRHFFESAKDGVYKWKYQQRSFCSGSSCTTESPQREIGDAVTFLNEELTARYNGED
jgi:hypothetical protein